VSQATPILIPQTKPEDPDTPVWRYMDFPRFVAMLEHRGLFFTPAEKMDDRFEGSLPSPDPGQLAQLRKSLEAAGIELPGNDRELLPRLRRWVSISSWHLNRHESAAMWKLYSASQQAIALQSTWQKLADSLGGRALLAKVRYISYGDEAVEFDSVYAPFLHKRRSFEFEHELRAVVANLEHAFANGNGGDRRQQREEGAWLPVDLNTLVDRIFIAPDAEPWYVDLVERVARRYGLSKPVKQSVLAEEPVY
jgi:hypothetical protein